VGVIMRVGFCCLPGNSPSEMEPRIVMECLDESRTLQLVDMDEVLK
jgi:hypothetical protein